MNKMKQKLYELKEANPFLFYLFILGFFSVIIQSLLGPVVCADGWASQSIGKQGACSFHGGVDHSGRYIGFFGGIAGCFFVRKWINS